MGGKASPDSRNAQHDATGWAVVGFARVGVHHAGAPGYYVVGKSTVGGGDVIGPTYTPGTLRVGRSIVSTREKIG